MLEYLDKFVKNQKFTIEQIVQTFSDLPQDIKKIVLEKFTIEPIRKIEMRVEQAAELCKNNPKSGFEIGEKLFLECRDEIHQLKRILGNSSLQFQIIANNVANEILQCGIAFFNERKNELNFNPGPDSRTLTMYADHLAVTVIVKQRIEKSLIFLEKWNKAAPVREKENKIIADVEFIAKKLESIESMSLDIAEDLILSCTPHLNSIKLIIGVTDPIYMNWSSAVANNIIGITVSSLNLLISENNSEIPYYIARAVDILSRTKILDMYPDIKNNLLTNLSQLEAMNRQIKSQKKSGCFIATLVYDEDYNHPQVLILREFRDRILSEYLMGRLLLKFYYSLSPVVARWMRKKVRLKKLTKTLLDRVIQIIK